MPCHRFALSKPLPSAVLGTEGCRPPHRDAISGWGAVVHIIEKDKVMIIILYKCNV